MRHYLLGAAMAVVAALTSPLAHADDEQTALQIARNLKTSGQLRHYSVEVGYQDGVATIGGRVASDQQRAIALDIASRSANVSRVVDKLSIASNRANPAPIQRTTGDAQPADRANIGLARLKNGLKRVTSISKPGNVATPRQTQPRAQAGVAPANATTQTAAIARQHPTPEQLEYQRQWMMRQQRQQYMAMRQRQMVGMGASPVGYALAAPLAAPAALAQRAGGLGQPMPAMMPGGGGRVMPASYDRPNLPNYAWPAYAPYNNYSRVTYPKQYSPTAWPFIGPFYPYPQVPLGWRKVTLEWDDGWWRLKFRHHSK